MIIKSGNIIGKPSDNTYNLMEMPVYEWNYSFAEGYKYGVEKGKEPNAFYRWMQRMCLGIIWTKT